MKKTQTIMGMHVTIEVVDTHVKEKDIEDLFTYFKSIDEQFSPYKKTSEVSKINSGELSVYDLSDGMQEVISLGELTRKDTNGYFDINFNGKFDPSGIVKGWAIWNASKMLTKKRFHNFYVDAGGDVQVSGLNGEGKTWNVGIRNPFKRDEIVKIVGLKDCGIATSGTAERGAHIYNPLDPKQTEFPIVSVSVIGANVFEADRFATAAFAMGDKGIYFLEKMENLEGYMIDNDGMATYTTGFKNYVVPGKDFDTNI